MVGLNLRGDCGAIAGRSFLAMLEKTGFVRARIVGTTAYRTSPYTIGTLFYGEKPGTPAGARG
jgi:hypothetical protein